MQTTVGWLISRNLGFPISAALFGISVTGLLADIVRWWEGRAHPLIMAFAIATIISGLILALAQRRLIRSFRYGKAGRPS